MRVLLLFLVAFGLASAAPYRDFLDEAGEDLVASFEDGFDSERLTFESEPYKNATENLKNKVVESLRAALRKIADKLKEKVEKTHENYADLIEKAKQVVERLQEAHADVRNKTKEVLAKHRGKVRDILQKLIDRLSGKREKRDIHSDSLEDELELNSVLLERSVAPEEKTVREHVREFLRNATGRFAKHYERVVNYLTKVWKKAVEKAGEKHNNYKNIARQAIHDMKQLHRETIQEIVEILRPHKEQLGDLWAKFLKAARQALKKNRDVE